MGLKVLRHWTASLVYQRTCCICDGGLGENRHDNSYQAKEWNGRFCNDCYQNVICPNSARCSYCGAITVAENPFRPRCRACFDWRSKFSSTLAVGAYQGHLREVVVSIKTNCDDIRAFQIGWFLGNFWDSRMNGHAIDWIVPVPSHWRRRVSRRGFHVADVIAEGFCRVTGLPKLPALKCLRHVEKQSTLTPKQRKENVQNAFAVTALNQVAGKQIVLIDDVMTTGATVGQCSRVLSRAKASAVYVAVIARATVET